MKTSGFIGAVAAAGIMAWASAAGAALDAAEVRLVGQGEDFAFENGLQRLINPASARFTPAGGFARGRTHEFRFRCSAGQIRLLTGRSNECAKVFAARGGLVLEVLDRAGRRVVYENVALNFTPPARTFSHTGQAADWLDHYAAAGWREPTNVVGRFAVTLTDTELLVAVNGIPLHRQPLEDIRPANLCIEVTRGLAFDPAVRTTTVRRDFLPVDIGPKLNARGIGAARLAAGALPVAGGSLVVGGIPFRIPESDEGYDNIDLRRIGLLGDKGGPEPGKRFPPANTAHPLAANFRIPYGNYNAVYALVACGEEPGTIPRFSVQFVAPGLGQPCNNVSSPDIPPFRAKTAAGNTLRVKDAAGRDIILHAVKVPIEPGQLRENGRFPFLELFLTKDIQVWRRYPDPFFGSLMGSGLPSAVRVFALTLGVSPVTATLDPDAFANIWVEGDKPSYTVRLENVTTNARAVTLLFRATSYDGVDAFSDTREVSLKPGQRTDARFAFGPKKFGYHTVSLVKTDDSGTETYTRSLAFLRRREHGLRGPDAKGMKYGNYYEHCPSLTPADIARIKGPAGFEIDSNRGERDAETQALMRRYGIKQRDTGASFRAPSGLDPAKGAQAAYEAMKKHYSNRPAPSELNEPTSIAIFSEPNLAGSHGTPPEFYGEPPRVMSDGERRSFDILKFQLAAASRAAREVRPELKVLLPHGDPCFAIPFIRDPATRDLIDGSGVDFGLHMNLPEKQQFTSTSIHRLWLFHEVWKQHRKDRPFLETHEGPYFSRVHPAYHTQEEVAANYVRAALLLAGYGIARQYSVGGPVEPDSSWGEQHYASGLVSRPSTLNPHVAYAAVATLTRHTRDALFESWTPVGTLGTYCLNFRNQRTNSLMRVLWTLRGTTEVLLDTPAGTLTVFDSMDNTLLPESRGAASVVTAGQLPLYVYGAPDDLRVAAGRTCHDDAKLGEHHTRLGRCADLFTRQTDDADELYRESFPEGVRRFHAHMSLSVTSAPPEFGGRSLAVRLPAQEKDRGVMPFYTCLKPRRPVAIPGRASHISVWVKAASDWGRIVYVLRDAAGRRWYSVGMRNEWNVDDPKTASYFNFDGWRLLRFEMPSHSPYDEVRAMGTSWWGSDDRDAVVALPLALEKIFVERREKAMYVNSLEPASPAPVELGDLYAEYASPRDMGREVLADYRHKLPDLDPAELPNPIPDLRSRGTLPAARILSVDQPREWQDGKRGVFRFETPEGAVAFDVFIARHPDGRGALLLGKNLKESGTLVAGFLPDQDFHAFLVYRNAKGEASVPSEPFTFRLQNIWAQSY